MCFNIDSLAFNIALSGGNIDYFGNLLIPSVKIPEYFALKLHWLLFENKVLKRSTFLLNLFIQYFLNENCCCRLW